MYNICKYIIVMRVCNMRRNKFFCLKSTILIITIVEFQDYYHVFEHSNLLYL